MEKKYVLLTGATGGLGKAFAFELAGKNKNLIITATKFDRLEHLKEEILNINNIILSIIF